MRVVWKGEQKGKKGERERKERGREEEKHSVLLGLLAGCWAGWVAFGLWEQLESQLLGQFLDHSDCMSKSGSAWHICRYGWNVPLTLGSETMCHSGRQETEPPTREGNGAPRSPVGACQCQQAALFSLAALHWVALRKYPTSGVRGVRESHMWKTVSSPSVFSTNNVVIICSSGQIWSFTVSVALLLQLVHLWFWKESVPQFNSTMSLLFISPSHTAILYVQFN